MPRLFYDKFVYAANEIPLVDEEFVRIFRYEKKENGRLQIRSGQISYKCDDEYNLTELEYFNGWILALERGFVEQQFRSRIYAFKLEDENWVDYNHHQSIVEKSLVFDFGETVISNFEAFCIGPYINERERILMVLNDDSNVDPPFGLRILFIAIQDQKMIQTKEYFTAQERKKQTKRRFRVLFWSLIFTLGVLLILLLHFAFIAFFNFNCVAKLRNYQILREDEENRADYPDLTTDSEIKKYTDDAHVELPEIESPGDDHDSV